MKHIKIFLLLSICLCIFLCSCNNLDLYEVYVEANSNHTTDSESNAVRYNDANQTFDYYSTVHKTVKKDMADKQLQLDTNIVILKYENTYNPQYIEEQKDKYRNETYGISATYREDNGQLESLYLGTYEYRIYDGIIDSEAKLMEICNNQLKKYGVDTSVYVSEVTTRKKSNSKLEGYVSPTEYENEILTYEVDYKYYLGEILTGDHTSITVSSDGYLRYFSYNMTGVFQSFKDTDVDLKRCNQLISAEMKSMCEVEGYHYTGYTDDQILIIMEGKLCLLSIAQPHYKEENEDSFFEAADIILLIPVLEL